MEAALEVLRTEGLPGTSTLAAQKAAGVSRGALLHHFSTRVDLLHAVIARLVELNEEAVRNGLADLPADMPAVERGVRAIYSALSSESFQLELEVWTSARTQPELLTALRDAERDAKRDLRRVVALTLGQNDVTESLQETIDIAVTFLQGMAVSQVLRRSDERTESLLRWLIGVLEDRLSRH